MSQLVRMLSPRLVTELFSEISNVQFSILNCLPDWPFPAVLVLDDADPHRQDVAGAVQGRDAAVLVEDVREEIFVYQGSSGDSHTSQQWLLREEILPQEVQNISVHVRTDHLEGDPLLLERRHGDL